MICKDCGKNKTCKEKGKDLLWCFEYETKVTTKK